jgi:hypothetical protein
MWVVFASNAVADASALNLCCATEHLKLTLEKIKPTMLPFKFGLDKCSMQRCNLKGGHVALGLIRLMLRCYGQLLTEGVRAR